MSKETNIVEEILIINRLIDSERQRWAQIKADKMALTVSQRDDLVTAYLDSLLDIQSKICCLMSQVLAAPLNGNILQVCPSVYRSAQEQQNSPQEAPKSHQKRPKRAPRRPQEQLYFPN